MRRIRSVNRRARTKNWRRSPDVLLQAWEGLIEDIDSRHVHVQLIDLINSAFNKEYGSFPLRLFRYIDIKLGLIVFVKISRNYGIRIILTEPIELESNPHNELFDLLTLIGKTEEEELNEETKRETSSS